MSGNVAGNMSGNMSGNVAGNIAGQMAGNIATVLTTASYGYMGDLATTQAASIKMGELAESLAMYLVGSWYPDPINNVAPFHLASAQFVGDGTANFASLSFVSFQLASTGPFVCETPSLAAA